MKNRTHSDLPEAKTIMVPTPDPTLLTTEQLLRENLWLREVLETRLDGMDKAIELLQATADKFPARIDEKISFLRDIHDEKFHSIDERFNDTDSLSNERFTSIQTQFKERDTRSEQSAKDGKIAVDAALTAQKEAVAEQNKSASQAALKQEASFSKQIDAQGQLIQTTAKASDDKVDDIKQRVTRLEERDESKAKTVVTQQASTTNTVAIVAIIISVILSAVTIAVAVFLKH